MTSHVFYAGAGAGGVTKQKSRTRMNVKPILKKLSHSEKTSLDLDLDRSWDEQDPSQQNVSSTVWTGYYGTGGVYYDGPIGGSAGLRSARDVTFAFSSTDNIHGSLHGGSGTPMSSSLGGSRSIFSHNRSASGTSHISVGTTGSGAGHAAISGRGGSFVHPFQQIPRTSTPPIGHGGSLAGFDASAARDYSPTIAEDDDDIGVTSDALFAHAASTTAAASPHGPSSLRRPSLASQRSTSFSDAMPGKDAHGSAPQSQSQTQSQQTTTPGMPQPPQPLRINTSSISSSMGLASRSFSGPSSSTATGARRLPHSLLAGASRSDLNLHASASLASGMTVLDSPTSTTLASPLGGVFGAAGMTPPREQLSPLRTSLDAISAPFSSSSKLRSSSRTDNHGSGSGADTPTTRAETIREARRRFEERERAKEEKHAREQVRRRERRDTKEAMRIERAAAMAAAGGSGSRKNSGTYSRKGSGTFTVGEKGATRSDSMTGSLLGGGSIMSGDLEKAAAKSSAAGRASSDAAAVFISRNYESVAPAGNPPTFGSTASDGDGNRPPRRSNTAKQKTQGAWTMFILWFRTRLLRLGRR